MTSKLCVNYLIYAILIGIVIWGFNNSDVYHEPFLFAFICIILIALFFSVPRETKLRQLLNTNRLAGLEKRVSQRKYEYIIIVVVIVYCGSLHLYYKENNIDSAGLTTMTYTIFGAIIGTFIKASMDKQEIKEIKQKQSIEKSEAHE
ncbi:hypothetical protein [Macrococcus animalis]|uniref:hypothetical protein n=1 Tax=Macrococcus animalis TaxID=3395467 RepID=UPI0039BDF30B